MEYRIESKPAFSLTGVSIRTPMGGRSFQDVPALWDRCLSDGTVDRLRKAAPAGSTIDVAGVCAEFDMKGGQFTYLVAIETLADRSALPDGCRDIPVPAATWGIFESRGPIPEAIQGLMQRIFGEWFPTSGWEHADGPELEIYSPGDIRDPNYYSEIWIPLQKATH